MSPKAGAPTVLDKKAFEKELARVMRRAYRLKAVLRGDANVTQYWREGYKEKRLREYKGHWVTIINVARKGRVK